MTHPDSAGAVLLFCARCGAQRLVDDTPCAECGDATLPQLATVLLSGAETWVCKRCGSTDRIELAVGGVDRVVCRPCFAKDATLAPLERVAPPTPSPERPREAPSALATKRRPGCPNWLHDFEWSRFATQACPFECDDPTCYHDVAIVERREVARADEGKRLEVQVGLRDDLLEVAWGLIANATESWGKESWRRSAERFREGYFQQCLGVRRTPPSPKRPGEVRAGRGLLLSGVYWVRARPAGLWHRALPHLVEPVLARASGPYVVLTACGDVIDASPTLWRQGEAEGPPPVAASCRQCRGAESPPT